MERGSDGSELLSSTSPQEGREEIIPSLVEQDPTRHHSSHRYGRVALVPLSPTANYHTRGPGRLIGELFLPYPIGHLKRPPGGLGQSGCVCISVSPSWTSGLQAKGSVSTVSHGGISYHLHTMWAQQRALTRLNAAAATVKFPLDFSNGSSVKQLCRVTLIS